MKINIKLLIIILLSIFSAGYVIITSRKIDNLKREILIEKAKNKVTDITFTTHAEDKCLSVAVSSIISRYSFLKEMDKLSKELGITLPKGANPMVDEVGKQIVSKYGKDKLNDISKLNFKNTDKILK